MSIPPPPPVLHTGSLLPVDLKHTGCNVFNTTEQQHKSQAAQVHQAKALCECECMCVCECLCVRLCVCECLCVRLCVCVFVNAYVSVHVYTPSVEMAASVHWCDNPGQWMISHRG